MTLTSVPTWTAGQAGGTGELTVPVQVPDAATAVAAHARVVGLLTTETEVTTELRTTSEAGTTGEPGTGTTGEPGATGEPTQLRVDLDRPSWRDLIEAIASSETVAPACTGPLPVRCRQPGLEIEYRQAELRIRYDRAMFDADFAARVGRYLVTAISSVVASAKEDANAGLSAARLLPEAERAELLRHGTARVLPEARFHELFAGQAAATPYAVAVVHGKASWTYAQLDRAANRVANALVADGLAAEEVVALAAGRSREWLAAIIGIFRAGGVYLPVEPDYPPARVRTLLEQSGSRRLLDDAALAAMLADPAGNGLWRSTGPRVPVAAGQLAYVYFTSGSTGLPKGALCEHAGMINHLTAKIDDFGLGAGDVVVQNAQASFDISLWQAIAPLLTGGRTVIVDREDILDVRRFVDTIGEATVLQLVPSYLDVLLRHLEQEPGGLGSVHTVSVTGEAISKALVNRFFAHLPGRRLINAYGATEASDDTTHEIMTAPPPGELVPVGRPIHNVWVYVLGPDGELVPPGAPGEIAFSGICVGRGYINDPQRTGQAFVDDPFRAGERMYRTGDFGRWLPTGHLEFHGRRDEQVKVHGVRIELGEVESRILEHPDVRTAAVVVTPLPGAGKRLVAYYCGDVAPAELADHLATVLPASAVPASLRVVDALPLTANGKVDKRALIALTDRDEPPARQVRRPEGDTARRIAAVWAQALDRPETTIGADDNFFDLGGSSLSALRVVAALQGLVSLDELVRSPVLSALAARADGAATSTAAGTSSTLLRQLAGPPAGPPGGPRLALVCLPYAAGAAINFQPLAAAVASGDDTVAAYALQAPGHDLSRPDEPLLELDELVKLAVDEIAAIGAPVALWGHCAGAPLALECARRLGDTVRHVFLAARIRESDAELTREIATVVAAADTDLATELVAQGGLQGPDGWDSSDGADGADGAGGAGFRPADLAFVGRVYRHDTRCANQYLLDAGQLWAGQRLECPVTVVLGTDDPGTDAARYQSWGEFCADLELAMIDGGGHLFARTRPAQAAELVLRATTREPSEVGA